MTSLLLAQLNFLEAIGALALIAGALYFWLTNEDKKKRKLDFFKFIINKDSKVRSEFEKIYGKYIYGSNDYEYNKALNQFFSDEKLKEINDRWEKEGTP